MADGFDKLKSNDIPSQKDIIIQELETKVQDLENSILEERFYWVLAMMIIINIIAFIHMPSWGGPIAIMILELFGLLALADKCGVDNVVIIITKIVDGWFQRNSNNEKTNK
ncbi:hypothetical protein [Nitrosomonas ureae]|uniref:Uncharacterized protein n=1 Tax=Nitrosomonas ureae TaxID=44577 RepID=A0A1H5TAH2_9PROT|nr:hypothetical protein [Nitrosomonas ureae]SEF58987.1 hypothetical protein SAMN05216334_10448 [Nitrosomonas ureae]